MTKAQRDQPCGKNSRRFCKARAWFKRRHNWAAVWVSNEELTISTMVGDCFLYDSSPERDRCGGQCRRANEKEYRCEANGKRLRGV
jgi:hypothetical protein